MKIPNNGIESFLTSNIWGSLQSLQERSMLIQWKSHIKKDSRRHGVLSTLSDTGWTLVWHIGQKWSMRLIARYH